jgi:hypothetical protein
MKWRTAVKLSKTPASWLALGFFLGAVVPAVGQSFASPEGDLSCSIGVDWHSNCQRPFFELEAERGESELNVAQYEFNQYQSCLTERAANDSRYVARAILEAATQELREVEEEAAAWGFTVR